MVEVIVNDIGGQLRDKNPYFQSHAVNAIQMPDGKVVANFFGEEPEPADINDASGISFYLRIEPKARVSKATKQYTSEKPDRYIARQQCHLVAFAFESPQEIDSQKWVDNLAASLLTVDLTRNPANPSIEIIERNASHIEAFLEETKKRFNVTKRFNCVKITFDLYYDVVTDENCNFCDIYKKPCP